jgi:rubrerythrin
MELEEHNISKRCIACYDTGIINKGTKVEEPCPICREPSSAMAE